MNWFCCIVMLMGMDLPERELALLRTFRAEFIHLTPGQGIYPASFLMGNPNHPSAQPEHKVTFAYEFHVAKYEVTQELWETIMGDNPSRWKGPRNAVENLSWREASQFCRRITKRLREARLITPNQRVRLPSEAEWEYAARAGTTTFYSFGHDPEGLESHAWYTKNAAGNDPPVGAKEPNPWGIHDVHGYLWEWCQDPWHDSYEMAPSDGRVWEVGGSNMHRVLRGGSWKDPAERLRSFSRRRAEISLRDDAVGLRCVLVEDSPQ